MISSNPMKPRCCLFAANIGLSRDMDSRWTTQYGALFCILNHVEQVVSWRLTSKLTFKTVLEQLMMLKCWLDELGSQLNEFYVDNCYTWHEKLQQVFGSHLLIYLDIFHVVKKISEKIYKWHTLWSPCMQEFKIVFCNPTDIGPERTKPTPNPQILEYNLDTFSHRWKDVAFNGVKVLSAAALSEPKIA